MDEKDIIQRIESLCKARSWSFYRLVKESGISYSTLNTMLNRGTAPTISTLSRICEGFGISLAEFFGKENPAALPTSEEQAHLAQWRQLSPRSQELASVYIAALLDADKK